MQGKKRKKGYTLIEIIVVMAILTVLVGLASVKYFSYSIIANEKDLQVGCRVLEDASMQYYMKKGEWPRVGEEGTGMLGTELVEKAVVLYSKEGKRQEINPAGRYYKLDKGKLADLATEAKQWDRYLIQNPVGNVYYIGEGGSQEESVTAPAELKGVEVVVKEPQVGEKRIIGDYEYAYKEIYVTENAVKLNEATVEGLQWVETPLKGWGVRVLDRGKSVYGDVESEIDGLPVISADFLYMGCSEMVQSPKLPSGLIRMYGTYKGCSKMEDATEIPTTVTDVREAYNGCYAMKETPRLPDDIQDMTMTFKECRSIVKVENLPRGVVDMEQAYIGCTSLEIVPVLPETVESLHATFYGCTELGGELEIPSKVKDMELSFAYTKITKVGDIANTVTSLKQAFMGNDVLTEVGRIGEGVLDMSEGFRQCKKLETVVNIPKNVVNVNMSFYGCSRLRGEMQIEGKPSVIDKCFGFASTDETGVLRLRSIGEGDGFALYGTRSVDAFSRIVMWYDRTKLESTIGATEIVGEYIYRYGMEFKDGEWVVPVGAVGSMQGWGARVHKHTKTEYASVLSEVEGKPVLSMAGTYLSCLNMVKSPSIPNGVKSLYKTYFNCVNMVTGPTVIPSSVTTMQSTFQQCSKLVTVPTIYQSVVNMESTFASCTSLEVLPVVPMVVTNIKTMMYNCPKVQGKFLINANVTEYVGCFAYSGLAAGPIVVYGGATAETKEAVAKTGSVTGGKVYFEVNGTSYIPR